QLDEIVFDLDVVMGTRQTEPGRALDGAACGVVQLSDQSSEIHGHGQPRQLGRQRRSSERTIDEATELRKSLTAETRSTQRTRRTPRAIPLRFSAASASLR